MAHYSEEHRKQFLDAVAAELHFAYGRHGAQPWSRHEAYAILKEEVDEVWDAIKRDEPTENVLKELVQVAAMCLRYAETGDRYRGSHPLAYVRKIPASVAAEKQPTQEVMSALEGVSLVVRSVASGHCLTVGVDVDGPPDNPTLYVVATVYGGQNSVNVVSVKKLSGWVALRQYLQNLSVKLVAHGKPDESMMLYPSVCCIDCGYLTGQVFDQSLSRVYAASREVLVVPVQCHESVEIDDPMLMEVPGNARKVYLLNRDVWVHRWLERVKNQPVFAIVIDRLPDEFADHHAANAQEWVLTGVNQLPGRRLKYKKIKGRKDNWFMAGMFSEVGAQLMGSKAGGE